MLMALSNITGGSVLNRDRSAYKPPVNTKYSLPTAYLGPLFNKNLNNTIGYKEIHPINRAFLKQLCPIFNKEVRLLGLDFNFNTADLL